MRGIKIKINNSSRDRIARGHNNATAYRQTLKLQEAQRREGKYRNIDHNNVLLAGNRISPLNKTQMTNQYLRQLRQYAEHNPKASTALLVAGTAVSCAAIVAFIELRDRYDYYYQKQPEGTNGTSTSSTTPTNSKVTPQEAQLAAMLENAKQSSWQENLRNANDAQQRFMLPGRDVDEGKDAPEYVKRIDERSGEILREEKERLEKENDPSKTRFWG